MAKSAKSIVRSVHLEAGARSSLGEDNQGVCGLPSQGVANTVSASERMGTALAEAEKTREIVVRPLPGFGMKKPYRYRGSQHRYNANASDLSKLSEQDQRLIGDYVFGDADLRKNPKIVAALERAIKVAGITLDRDMVSYRGVALTKEQFAELTAGAKLKLGRVASLTDEERVAYDFVKPQRNSVRNKGRDLQGVVLRILLPRGTRTAYLNLALGVGSEHVISGKTRYRVVSAPVKLKKGFRVDVEVIP